MINLHNCWNILVLKNACIHKIQYRTVFFVFFAIIYIFSWCTYIAYIPCVQAVNLSVYLHTIGKCELFRAILRKHSLSPGQTSHIKENTDLTKITKNMIKVKWQFL